MKFARRTGGGLVCVAVFTLPLLALNPAYQISQYVHTEWKSDSGLQAVRRLAQTPDGYLWLATRAGLVRFDGNRFTTFRAGSIPGLESSTAQDLLVDRDGSLWIATLGGGVSHYEQGIFRSYGIREGIPSDDVNTLYRDTQGVLWAGTRDGKIARFVNGRFEEAPIVIPGNSVSTLLETADRSLWIATSGHGVLRLRDGVLTEFSVPQGLPDARVIGLCRDRSGKLWTAGWKGVSWWNGTQFVTEKAVGDAVAYAIGCREDRDGNLWIAASSGLFRLRQGKVTKLNRDSGLSSDFVSDVFEDRDGNLWIGTRAGLRLQDGPVRMFTRKEGLLGDTGPIVIGEQGAVWTSSNRQVTRITGNDLTVWPGALSANHPAISMLPQPGSQFLFGSTSGVVRWSPHSSETVSALRGMNVRCMLQARDGSIWIGTADHGLLHWKPSAESSASIEVAVADNSIVTLAQDRAGAIWAGSLYGRGLYRFESGKMANFGRAEGLKSTNLLSIFADEKGDLWIGSTGGLSWLHNGQFRTVNSRQGLPADQILAIVGDSYDRLWFTTFAGIVSIDKSSLLEWAENRRERLNPTVYRGADAVQTYTVGRTFPDAVRSPDGHLWFSFGNGLAEVIPPRPGSSREPQFPVLIEEINVDGARHSFQDRLRIPAGTRSIEIRYTAIALTNPQSVRFRYRLRGIDRDWVQADSRRIVFYNNLQPGSYAFAVSASSGDGKWKDAPILVLEQAPFFYQTPWFIILAAAAAVSAAVLAYRVHVQRAIDRVQAGFQHRMDERTRIARDLHDTLLQSFHAVLLKFSAFSYRLPDRPELRQELETILAQARRAVTEGRDAVEGLRSSTVVTNELAESIRALGEELAADENLLDRPELSVQVENASRQLAPVVRDEVYRIGCEAVRNAFRHAQASQVEVTIQYGDRHFRMRVSDNGKGIDPAILAAGGRAGHHGLPGMQERAGLAQGKLNLASKPDSGTEVELTVPASIAYVKSSTLPPKASGKEAG